MPFDLDALKAQISIADVVGEATHLVADGRNFRGSCPIHGGTGPNLVVYPESGTWHCFSCGCHDGHSDVIGFTELLLGVDFKAAVEHLGGKASNGGWTPSISKPVKPAQPDRVTSKPPVGSRPDMEIRSLGGAPARTWDYLDADGELLGIVARYETAEGKEIRCWTWGARGTASPGWAVGGWTKPRPLYGLDRLAARPDSPVLITEGEKACDAAQQLLGGYVAVTWPGGAGAWKHADLAPLAGKTVLLWPDADVPGIKAMADLSQVLVDPNGLRCAVRLINPADWREGYDAADFQAEGGTTQDLINWARPRTADVIADANTALPDDDQPPPYAADVPPPEGSTLERPQKPRRKPRLVSVDGNTALAPGPDGEVLPLELSEIGVAAKFCDLYHNDFRVVHEWGGKHGVCWLAWDGTRWVREATRKTAYQKMTVLCTGLKYHDAARGMTEASKAKFERALFISSCLTHAQYDTRLIAAPDIWDADPLMLGTPSGAVDLREGKQIEAEREQYITRQTTIAPEPGAHPLFDDVIRRAAGGDDRMTAYLWRALGYGAVTGCVNEEVFWYLWGKPQCGKTTLIEAIADLLGDVDAGGYACQVEIDIFTESKQDGRNADRLAHLAGARFAYASEMEEGKNFKAALLKMAVGGDRMGGKFLYQERFTFKPTHKIWIFGNQIMHLRTADQGIRRRMHLIEYDDRFIVTDEERDNNFKTRLRAEYPAILYSLIRGALDWQECGGLGMPEQITQGVESYMQSEDTLSEFVAACLDLDTASRCRSSVAYTAYKHWCDGAGEYCCSSKRFTQQMKARGFVMSRSTMGQYFNGFSVRASDQDDRSPPPNYYDK